MKKKWAEAEIRRERERENGLEKTEEEEEVIAGGGSWRGETVQ